jgi:hypothetical protein
MGKTELWCVQAAFPQDTTRKNKKPHSTDRSRAETTRYATPTNHVQGGAVPSLQLLHAQPHQQDQICAGPSQLCIPRLLICRARLTGTQLLLDCFTNTTAVFQYAYKVPAQLLHAFSDQVTRSRTRESAENKIQT